MSLDDQLNKTTESVVYLHRHESLVRGGGEEAETLSGSRKRSAYGPRAVALTLTLPATIFSYLG